MRRRGVRALLWGWFWLVSVGAAGSASAQELPDVVRLVDGSYVRGTIVERMEGEHVVIQTVTGELRTFPMAEVAFAGARDGLPVTSTAGIPMLDGEESAPTPDIRHVVTISAEQPGLRLYVEGHTTMSLQSERYDVGVMASYDLVCAAPCTAELPHGLIPVWLALPDGRPLPAGSIRVESAMRLWLHFEDRSGERAAGTVMLLLGGVPGLIFLALSLAGNGVVDPGFLGVGIAGTAIAIGGIPLIAWGDVREVRQRN